MDYHLKICGRADMDGTHRAVVETNLPEFDTSQRFPTKTRILKIRTPKKNVAVLISEVRYGDSNKIWIDRFKQWHLGVRDDEEVIVEEISLPTAQKVDLRAPQEFTERDIARFIGKPLTKGEKTVLYTFSGEARSVDVIDVKPGGTVLVAPDTEVSVITGEVTSVSIRWVDIGGLNREINLIREVVEYPLRFPDVFDHLGVSQPRGIILHGPPGTGKTLIAKALANEVGAHFIGISGPELFSMWYGETERKLRQAFDEAQKNAPSVILIDELDAMAPRREKVQGEVEQRLVATLLTLMDGLKQLKGVVVVGTTNRINSIDNALRREGRFGHEVYIGVPDTQGRKDIIKIHSRRMPLSSDVNLDVLAEKTRGFVGADIASLCREAAYNTLRRSFDASAFEKGKILPHEGLEVNQSDFDKALSNISPSAMKEFLIEIPKVTWDDIGGLEDVKRLLIENIVYAITKRDVFKKVGVKPAKGVLLYGPPGTGKTLLAKAVANQCGVNFIAVKGPEIRTKWVGESEEKIRFLFSKAREVSPCVIFFDEIDAAVPARGSDNTGVTDSIVNQVLSEMDGIENAEGVFVMGATNRVELLDPALLRPGRFDYHIEVPLPDPTARKAIFAVCLKEKPIADDVNVNELVNASVNLSGAEISEICREAIWEAIRDSDFEADKVKLTMTHLRQALTAVKATKSNLGKGDKSYVK